FPLLIPRPPTSTLFPYTTLFRSDGKDEFMGDGGADLEDQLLDLRAELRWERTLRERADDMVHFLQMECQFKMCACRIDHPGRLRSEEYTSELHSRSDLVCRLLLE